MGFFRRKPHGPVEEVPKEDAEVKKERESRLLRKEQQQRNRLSKPRTNTSSMNLSVTLTQEASISNRSLTSPVEEKPVSQVYSNESREVIRSHIFGPDANTAPTAAVPTIPQDQNASVASLVAKLENSQAAVSTSQLSATPSVKINRSFSGIFGSRRSSGVRGSLVSRSSRELLKGGENKVLTPSSSRDQLAENHAPRPRREATFTPGAATRKTSDNNSSIEEESEAQTPSTHDEEFVPAKEEFFDEPDDWMPPPRTFRSETPADLDYTHLGGLTLGSLHVVNGRASPAISELSKHLMRGRIPRPRDASSQYGDSDDGTRTEQWEDMEVIDEESGHQRKISNALYHIQNRQFSFEGGEEKRLNRTEKLQALDPIVTSPPQTPTSRDKTSVLADSYIAELPLSPYAPSPPDSDAGSVRHHGSRRGSRAFEEALMRRSPERRAESQVSWYSPIEPELSQDEAFMSAVEIQQITSAEQLRPEMPVRSSAKSDSGYSSNTSLSQQARPLEETVVLHHSQIQSPKVIVRHEFRMSPPKQLQQSPASPATIKTASTIVPSTAIIETARIQPIDAYPPRTPVQTAETASVQTPKTAELVPATPTSLTSKPEQPSPKANKMRKKLQKTRRKSTAEVAKELVVQRVISSEVLNVPAVTSDAETNLAMRSEAVPELQKTYQTQHAVKNQASLSVLSFLVPDIRFPSPAPEAQDDSKRSNKWSRPGKRDRSKSRPRTWFGKSKDDSKSDRRMSLTSNEGGRSGLGDLGDVIDNLGTNPYDIASVGERPRSNHGGYHPLRSSPYNITTQAPRPKSMMDDRAAIHFSRLRSRSIQERDGMGSRRSSFNDRGGIPGKNFRPASMATEAPPLPPMPNREEIERRFSNRQSSYNFPFESPKMYKHHWHNPMSSEPNSSPAPPPPAHSTLPIYSHPDEEEMEPDHDIAPPPPSHSPRPRDITPEPLALQEDTWAQHARAWEARRISAGEALRQSWDEQQYEQQYQPHYEPQYAQPQDYEYERQGYYLQEEQQLPQEEPLYPDIPLRNGSKWMPGIPSPPVQQAHAAEIWADQDYQNALKDYFGHQEQTTVAAPVRPLPHRQRSRASYQSQSIYSRENHPRSRSRSPYHSRSRPQSRNSYASSLAEELHPADLKRVSPAPDYGRYSGGFEFGYEGRDRGFGGSAGTRSVSGKADGKRKSGASINDFGLDFSDIPAMGVPVGAVGNKFRYDDRHD